MVSYGIKRRTHVESCIFLNRQRADPGEKKRSREGSRKKRKVVSKAFVDSSDEDLSDNNEPVSESATGQKLEEEDKVESDNEPPTVTTDEASSSDR